MSSEFHLVASLTEGNSTRFWQKSSWILMLLLSVFLQSGLCARPGREEDLDITGNYQFLAAEDTLALLEEEGRLKGYIDVFQGEEESDVVLSYQITLGWHRENRVEFKTAKIHQMYYRFAGTVERGTGKEEADPDYLRLVGDLEIVTVKSESGEEGVQRVHVVFKSVGRTAKEED